MGGELVPEPVASEAVDGTPAARLAEVAPLELTEEVLASEGLALAVAQVENERAAGNSIHEMSVDSLVFLARLGMVTANFVRWPGTLRAHRGRAKVARVLGARNAQAREDVSHLPGYSETELNPDLIRALEAVTRVHGHGVHAIPDPHARGKRRARNAIVVADAMILGVASEEDALRLVEPLQIWLRTMQPNGGPTTVAPFRAPSGYEVAIRNMTEFAPRGVGAVLEEEEAEQDRAAGMAPSEDKRSFVDRLKSLQTFPAGFARRLQRRDADYQTMKQTGRITATYRDAEGNIIRDVTPVLDANLLGRDLPTIQAMRNIFNGLIHTLWGSSAFNEEQPRNKKLWFMFQRKTRRLERPIATPQQLQGAPPPARLQNVREQLADSSIEAMAAARGNIPVTAAKITGKALGGIPGLIQDTTIAVLERAGAAIDYARFWARDFNTWLDLRREFLAGNYRIDYKMAEIRAKGAERHNP
jgi:hypothetical protein